MLKRILFTAMVCLVGAGSAFAQSGTLTGTITDAETGETLVGANVMIEELSRGTATDVDGQYEITGIPSGTYTVNVSYIGYNEQTKTASVSSGETELNFALTSGINLNEVVVTALGEEVNVRTVTFSTQEINSEQLNVAQDANIKTGLAGKVAGVQIVGQAGSKLGDFGGIRVRGAISLTDEMSEPLYVVDGVPVSDPNVIDMNNVADINVLKGPNATALYGQRGESGVVLISTKNARQSGVSVELTNATTFEQVAYLPNFQNKYGKGYSGDAEWVTMDYDYGRPYDLNGNGDVEDGEALPYPSYLEAIDGQRFIKHGYADESWGPEFDGEPYSPWYSWYPESPYYGETAKWEAQPNNVKNFYDTGVTSKTGFAVNYSTNDYAARLSYTNLNQGGILPYSTLGKHFLNGRFNYDVTEDFNVGVNFNYTTQEVNGDVLSDGYGNQTSGSFNSWFGRQLSIDKMRELKDLETPEGYLASWNAWGPWYMPYGSDFRKPAFWYNPYTWMERYDINRKTDNVLVNVDLSYEISDQFEITGSANTTTRSYSRRYELPNSLAFSAAPELYNAWVNGFGVYNNESKEHNFSSRLKYRGDFGDWSVDAFVGAQARIQEYNSVRSDMDLGNWQNGGLIIPDVYNFGNSAERMIPIENNWDKQVLSMFAKATFGYKDYLYVDGTYRQDYSSALPAGNNGYGYPSVGVSFVFSELVESDILSYGKLRAGWAQVGNDVAAEKIDQTYHLQQDPYTNPATTNPATLLSTSDVIVDPNIKPALSSSFEAGTDLRFLDDRVGLNLTYFNENRTNEIIDASLSSSTGYTAYLTNAGSLEREGVEVSLNGTPVQSQAFQWDVNVNWSTSSVIVTSLPAGLQSYEMGASSSFDYVFLTHRLGEEWGQLRGPGIKKNENGQPVVNEDGLYEVVQNQYFGSVLPDWTGGFLNTFSYKGISLAASIDYQKGGKFFTLSEQWGQYSGLLEETADNNDLGNPKRDAAWTYDEDGNRVSLISEDERGGVHVTGVDANGNAVDTYVEASDYYGQWQDNTIAEPFIHDASFVKLRELSLSYRLPQRWIGNFLQSATVGVIGRNLWMIAVSDDNVHGWDPSELAESYGENGQLPGTKSYGFNVKVTF